MVLDHSTTPGQGVFAYALSVRVLGSPINAAAPRAKAPWRDRPADVGSATTDAPPQLRPSRRCRFVPSAGAWVAAPRRVHPPCGGSWCNARPAYIPLRPAHSCVSAGAAWGWGGRAARCARVGRRCRARVAAADVYRVWAGGGAATPPTVAPWRPTLSRRMRSTTWCFGTYRRAVRCVRASPWPSFVFALHSPLLCRCWRAAGARA